MTPTSDGRQSRSTARPDHGRARVTLCLLTAGLAGAGLGALSAPPGAVGAPVPVARAAAPSAAPRPIHEANLVANPAFEGAYRPVGANELVVADGWLPWFRDGADLRRPEYKDEPFEWVRPDGTQAGFSIRVFHGEKVQKMFTSNGSHDAGVAQVVPVARGSRLRFSVWVHTWSSDCDDPCISPLAPCRPGSSNTHGTYRASAGIDPYGAPPPAPGEAPPNTVVWSAPVVFEPYQHWFLVTVEAPALADRVVVYTRGNPVWPVKHNDSYWDDARLEVTAGPGFLTRRIFAPWLSAPVRLDARRMARATPWAPPPRAVTAAAPAQRPADPVPPDADVRIEYPVRAYPDQENFGLPTCDDLDFEAVIVKNHGLVDVTMTGWRLADTDGNAYVFPALVLAPGERVRVWTKPGPDSTDGAFTDLHWGRTEPVWDGPGGATPFDEAVLADDAGREVARRGYP